MLNLVLLPAALRLGSTVTVPAAFPSLSWAFAYTAPPPIAWPATALKRDFASPRTRVRLPWGKCRVRLRCAGSPRTAELLLMLRLGFNEKPCPNVGFVCMNPVSRDLTGTAIFEHRAHSASRLSAAHRRSPLGGRGRARLYFCWIRRHRRPLAWGSEPIRDTREPAWWLFMHS